MLAKKVLRNGISLNSRIKEQIVIVTGKNCPPNSMMRKYKEFSQMLVQTFWNLSE